MAKDKETHRGQIYTIYSHFDADGGIAAAIFAKFIKDKYTESDIKIQIEPVNHISQAGEWYFREIKWPCAILDFTLHPALLSEKFFVPQTAAQQFLHCYWIDHHPTGSSFPFLTEKNTAEMIPGAITKWDTSAISTPGLLRTHQTELKLPADLIQKYEEFIDLAEIIDGALYATSDAAHDFSSPEIKLQTLFHPSHPAIDKNALYKEIVKQIINNSSPEELFDSDPVYGAILQYEENIFHKQLQAYKKTSQLRDNVVFTSFSSGKSFHGLGRFIPYILFPAAQYALHVLPPKNGVSSLSCGINPWNKPKETEKHLGNYFAKHFHGGGHAFVAGGKVTEDELTKIENLLKFLND